MIGHGESKSSEEHLGYREVRLNDGERRGGGFVTEREAEGSSYDPSVSIVRKIDDAIGTLLFREIAGNQVRSRPDLKLEGPDTVPSGRNWMQRTFAYVQAHTIMSRQG